MNERDYNENPSMSNQNATTGATKSSAKKTAKKKVKNRVKKKTAKKKVKNRVKKKTTKKKVKNRVKKKTTKKKKVEKALTNVTTQIVAHPDIVDLRHIETPGDAASQMHSMLCDMVNVDYCDGNPDDIFLLPPGDDRDEEKDCWRISWLNGPTEWATNLCMGYSILDSTYPRQDQGKPSEFLLNDGRGWWCESHQPNRINFYE